MQRLNLSQSAPIDRPDLWAVWPCGTECSIEERLDMQELLSWKSDDYEIRRAIGYDECDYPIFE